MHFGIHPEEKNTEAIWGETSRQFCSSKSWQERKGGQRCGDKNQTVPTTKQTNGICHFDNPRSKVSPN